MKLFKLELHNFRQYQHQEIYFPQNGLIGVLGLNGAGKSTLFNAIGWCLYGKIKGVTNAMIKNQSASKKEKCYVEMDFEYQGNFYRIHRDLVSSKTYAQINGVTRAIGTTNLNSFVENDLFKMDHKAFTVCYYAQQDDFDALAKLNPGPRVATMSKLLQIDTIDTAAENKRREKRQLESEVVEMKKHLKDEEALQEQSFVHMNKIKELKSFIKETEALISLLDNQYKNLLIAKEDKEKDYRKHEQLLNEKDGIQKNIDSVRKLSLEPNEARLTKLKKAQERYDVIEKYKAKYQQLTAQKEVMINARTDYREKVSLEKEISSLKLDVNKYLTEYNQIKEELASYEGLEEKSAILNDTIKQLQQEVLTLRENYKEHQERLKNLVERLSELKEEKERFDKLGSDTPCPTCLRPLGEHYGDTLEHIKEKAIPFLSQKKELEIKLEEIKTSGNEKSKELSEQQKMSEELQVSLRKKSSLSERYKNIEKELNVRKKQYENLKQKYELVKDVQFDEALFENISNELTKITPIYEEVIRIENSLDEIPEIEKLVNTVKNDISLKEENIINISHSLSELNFDVKLYEQLKSDIEEVRTSLDSKNNAKSKAEADIIVEKSQIDIINEKLKEQEKAKLEINEKQKRMVLLDKLNEAYKQYKIDILSKLAPTLAEMMSEDIDSITQGKYHQIELDDEYNIFIYRDGVKNPLSFYSGGEQKLAALCLRLAISNLLTEQTGQADIEMLAMDEVFGSMDNERQDQMIDMLRNLNEMYSQILIVTHSESVKEMFDYVLEIKQDKYKNSISSWVTPWDEEEVRTVVSSYDSGDVEETSDEEEEEMGEVLEEV